MRVTATIALLCASLASAATTTSSIKPGAVTSHIAPNQAAPSGCSPNYSGTFQIGPVNVSSSGSSKRNLIESRDTSLGITLKDGILTDPLGRTGYIASNEQFQFDGPPQAGAIWTSGFSICPNGSLALGNDVTWWSCLSGTFYNLYFTKIGAQCIESYIVAYGVDGGHYVPASVTPTAYSTTSSGSSASAASTSSKSSNATMSSSSSSSSTTKKASNGTMTMSSSSSGAAAAGGHHTSMKTTKVPNMHTTQGSGSGSGSGSNGGASASSSATGSGNAAPTNAAVGAVLGVAGGLAAFAAML